jgi:hypothetical protein
MSTVTIPRNGIQFFFTDTGPPPDVENYTTYILVHGHTYHAGKVSDCFRIPISTPF